MSLSLPRYTNLVASTIKGRSYIIERSERLFIQFDSIIGAVVTLLKLKHHLVSFAVFVATKWIMLLRPTDSVSPTVFDSVYFLHKSLHNIICPRYFYRFNASLIKSVTVATCFLIIGCTGKSVKF